MQIQALHDEGLLLQQVAEGNELAFRKIYDAYRKRIWSFAFHLTESELMADEVVQEVFMKLWLNKHNLSQVSNFNAWIHTIARNNIFDSVKKAAKEAAMMKQMGIIKPMDENNVDTFVFDKENEEILQQALSQLSPQQRQVFLLSRNQGLKYDEIAAQLNISRNTVKTHLSNALHTIKEQLNMKGITVLALCIIFGCE